MKIHRSLAVLGTAAAALAAAPALASANTVADLSNNNPVSSGTVNLGGYAINGGVDDLALLDLDVTAKAKWDGNLWTTTSWESGDVRQGDKLTVNRTSPIQLGTMHVTWSISGRVNPLDQGYVNIGTVSVSDDASCTPALTGSNLTCTAQSPGVALVKTPGIPASPYVKVMLKAKFTVTPEGAITGRTFSVAGTTPDTGSGLPLGNLPGNSETLTMPCVAAGSAVSYRVGALSYSPSVALSQQPTIEFGLMDPVLGAAELPAIYDHPFGLVINSHPSFTLTGAGHTSNLGGLLANNVAPIVSVPTSFKGTAGSPVGFYAGVNSRCGAGYVWHFSNGTTSYGANPLRTFAKGNYDGELIVTDTTGLQTTKSFSVVVS